MKDSLEAKMGALDHHSEAGKRDRGTKDLFSRLLMSASLQRAVCTTFISPFLKILIYSTLMLEVYLNSILSIH